MIIVLKFIPYKLNVETRLVLFHTEISLLITLPSSVGQPYASNNSTIQVDLAVDTSYIILQNMFLIILLPNQL